MSDNVKCPVCKGGNFDTFTATSAWACDFDLELHICQQCGVVLDPDYLMKGEQTDE